MAAPKTAMTMEEQTKVFENSIISLGRQLDEGGAEKAPSLYPSLEAILREAEQKKVFLPFAQLGESLSLDGAEQLLLSLLWYRKREKNRGLPCIKMNRLLRACEGLRAKTQLAACFWPQKAEVILSPVAQGFLEAQLPSLAPGVDMTLPEKETCYGLDSLFEAARRMAQEQARPDRPPAALVLNGEAGSGRHFAARQLAARLETALVTVEAPAVLETDRQISELLLCAQLYQALLCIEAEAETPALKKLLKGIAPYIPFLLLIKKDSQPLDTDLGYDWLTWQLERPDRKLKKTVFQDILARTGTRLPQGSGLEAMASRRLPMGSYIRQCRNFCLRLRLGISPEQEEPFRPESPYLKPIPANRTMEELKLPGPQKERLYKICRIIGASAQVREQWGYGRKYSYGNGISVLFYGAPGTGKTMAAQALANALGLPLLRADLSQLTSKYIGETQKNIGRIFDEAQTHDCILLFDEADALFARRSEVSDAQDRYSNGETAYLLQRMEQYGGVSVLATNLLQNFDEAFRRRITYMVHFPMPDEALRRQLWESVIPEEAAVSCDIDYETLAGAFEISGAAIKNASFHAACCAFAEGCQIQMRHLLDGVENEYMKTGKNFSEEQRQLARAWKEEKNV